MASTIFRFVPAIMYRGVGAPNIMQRFRLPESVIKNSLLFHKYVIVDGDRPDTIAHHYYGSSLYDWVVALSFQMMDVHSEWPLTQEALDDHIVKTYGSIATALTTIDHYKLDGTKDPIDQVTYDSLPPTLKKYWTKVSTTDSPYYSIRPSDITIAPSSYAILGEGESVYWTSVSKYDNEFAINEAKRTIKLIDAQAVPGLEKALRAAANE